MMEDNNGVMYMATSYWRGALNINEMRLFSTEKDAIAYARSLNNIPALTRVYKLCSNQQPVLIKNR
jgi:hypothetical protein